MMLQERLWGGCYRQNCTQGFIYLVCTQEYLQRLSYAQTATSPIALRRSLLTNINLLSRNVTQLGGCERVIQTKHWRDAAESFNFPETITSVSFSLRKAYITFLWDYEQVTINSNVTINNRLILHKCTAQMYCTNVLRDTRLHNQVARPSIGEIQFACQLFFYSL